ncbi:hypothetical protein SAMN05216522_11191 [Rosenbergiella nectarea]|uniref:Uncharacterized protein n=1 Tax=Rosenbergiella nectarea TaxID=988801 RepID=A0A1H9LGQ6_9GAMM|nr:hypothetical protein SAMN05216522_11191 [Rosenbergiella nectarea]
MIAVAGYLVLEIIGNNPKPLTETIFPTQSQCEHQIEAMKDIQPKYELVCVEKW